MKKLFFAISLCVICLACSNDSNYNIPNVKFVSDPIYLDLPLYNDQSFIVEPGSGKIVGVSVVVYKKNPEEYYAFDLTCTYNHKNGVQFLVELETKGDIIVKCPECYSRFLINTEFGAVVEGPAPIPLKPYRTSYKSGNNSLVISNP